MLAAADSYRTQIPFWEGFWAFLWDSSAKDYSLPLKSNVSQSQLRAVIADIAARYDLPPVPPQPKPGTPYFTLGQPGVVINQERSMELLDNALRSLNSRTIDLPVAHNQQSLPTLLTLETLIKQIITVNEFDGLTDIFMVNLQNGQDLHIVLQNGQNLTREPDIAFSGLSVIKIGIMLATYRSLDGPPDAETAKWLEEMIKLSGNDPSDWLMQRLDLLNGPLKVAETLQLLGLENTFIAGYFRPPPVLLRKFSTPSNQRDFLTDLDPFNQTTPKDIGTLLEDLYLCAQGGGTLPLVFPGEITQEECTIMIDLLSQDHIGILLQGGVPEGTKVAHKHGWDPVLFHVVSDAGIVYTPGGNYILSIFLWRQNELLFDQASKTIADISKAVYNYYNPSSS
jgi:hypothetical protein